MLGTDAIITSGSNFQKKSGVMFFIVFILCFSSILLISLPKKSFAGADGSGNNFFYKAPAAFSVAPPDKFITFQGITYQTWGSAFSNNGSVTHLSGQTDKFVFLPEFIWTRKILGITNFFEVVTPVGSASQNTPESSAPNSSNGLGDIMFFYGIFSKNYSAGNLSYDFFPQISFTVPTGQWNSNSAVNIGGNTWQIMPALTGQISYELPAKESVALDYAVGYSKNQGISTIDTAPGAVSYTDPGNNIFADFYLNYFIVPKLDIYNETAYIKQFDNYGYKTGTTGTAGSFGLLNNGYKDVASGFGIDYHFTKSFQGDARVLKDLHGDNGPDGYYGMIDVIMAF